MTAGEWLEWMALLAGLATLHLGWQVAAVAGVVVGLERLESRIAVQLRYALALGLFLVLPLLALGSVGWLISARGETLPASVLGAGSRTPWTGLLVPWLGVVAVASGVVAVLRLVGGAVWLRRRTVLAPPAPRGVVDRVATLSRSLGLHRPPAVRVDSACSVPAVVGLRTPIIVLPVGVEGLLAPGELDSILAHELLHVRRSDLLTNALQRFTEALLRVHPAAGWLSRKIDHDRELCCDDEVRAMASVDRRTYARALTRLALSAGAGVPRGALGADRGDVLRRVRRLLDAPRTVSPRPVSLHAVGVALLIVCAGAFATRVLVPRTVALASCAPIWQLRVLSSVEGSYTVQATDPAGRFVLSVRDGRAVGARVAGHTLTRGAIRQRGARVTLAPGRDLPSFSVTLQPEGGIVWQPRVPVPSAVRRSES